MVDHHAALAGDVGGEVDRETEGVVELEYRGAVEHPVLSVQRVLEHLHAVFQCLGETLLFLLQHVGHPVLRGRQFRIGLAHHPRKVADQLVEERPGLAELVAVTDGAADDPAQHIAAALVAGDHAVGDQKRAGADMVGDYV